MARFSRYHKYTLGTDLRDKSWLEELLILIRICKEVKAFKSFTNEGVRS